MKNGGSPEIPLGDAHVNSSVSGLTKREHLAGLAMQALLSNPNVVAFNANCAWGLANCTNNELSKICVEHADSLLKALDGTV